MSKVFQLKSSPPHRTSRIQISLDRGLHAEVKRLLAKRFLAGNPMQMIDVMDEALRDWLKKIGKRKRGNRP